MNASLLGGARAIFPSAAPDAGAAVDRTVRSDRERAMFSQAAARSLLQPGEAIEPLLVRAGAAALEAAGITASQVDRLYGAAVLGAHVEPSPLYFVHHALGLRRDALVVPQGTNFAAFVTGLVLAAEAVKSGVARHALVVVGSRMSPHVEAGSGYAVSIADGAGAVVVGQGDRNVILDFATDTEGTLYDATALDARAGEITFGFSEKHLAAVRAYGEERPVMLVKELLLRHGVQASDVALVGHQASRVLMEHWCNAIGPGEHVDTFDEHGNATLASIPMTLASRGHAITKPYLVLMSPGMGMHATAVLVRQHGEMAPQGRH